MKIARYCFLLLLISMVALGCARKKEETAGLAGLDLDGENKDAMMQTVMPPEPEIPITAPQGQPAPVEPGFAQLAAPVSAVLSSDIIERNKQIQTALKNANFYFGEIDGKAGPLTRKAIEEFQKMKGLKVDGKVGPMTWSELQKYLTVTPAGTNAKNRQ